MNALLSIVIPTKDRSECALAAVRSCLRLGESVQIVVVDSSADDGLNRLLKDAGLHDAVTYTRTDPSLNIVENFETALDFAKGTYVTYIGDDDFLSQQIVQVAEFVDLNRIECCNFTFPVTYRWPDFRHRKHADRDSACVTISPFSGNIKKVNPDDTRRRALMDLGRGPGSMPRLYTGLVRLDLLKQVRAKYGALFGGVSPDVFSSLLLSLECRSFIEIDFPIVIPGISGNSGSGYSSEGRHEGDLWSNHHIRSFRSLVWDERVPAFYSVSNVWGYSALKAVDVSGCITDVNLASLYLKAIIYNRTRAKLAFEPFVSFLKSTSGRKIIGYLHNALLNEAIYVFRSILQQWLSRKLGAVKYIRSVADAEKASHALDDYLREHGSSIKLSSLSG